MRKLCVLLLLFSACGGGDREPDTGDVAPMDSVATTDTAPSAPSRPQTPPDWDSTRLPPTAALVREDACPFECCQYGEWRSTRPIPVFRTRGATTPAFELPADTPFIAEGGTVRVTSLARAIIEDTVSGGDLPPDVILTPADTLYLVQQLGEGWFRVWSNGRELDVPGLWDDWYRNIHHSEARLEGEYRHEWWVRVRLPDGRRGWIRMDGDISTVLGVDACA